MSTLKETPTRPTLFQLAVVELRECHAGRCRDGYRYNACGAERPLDDHEPSLHGKELS